MDRQEFIDIVYSELESDLDNRRANRIIEAADEYAESTNLVEVSTDCISREYLVEHIHACMENDRLMQTATKEEILQMVADTPSAQPEPCEDAISRSDAILAIQRHGVGCYNAEYFSSEQSERYVINLLKALPSVGSK